MMLEANVKVYNTLFSFSTPMMFENIQDHVISKTVELSKVFKLVDWQIVQTEPDRVFPPFAAKYVMVMRWEKRWNPADEPDPFEDENSQNAKVT